MSLLSLSNAAGPSSATLEALSDYCASSDSPSPKSFSYSDSKSSLISESVDRSQSNTVPQLPDIIMQSDRFQSSSVQEKMLSALRSSTGSGFTRSETSTRRSSRRNREVSTQAIYEGLPASPSDCFFNDASVLENSTPTHLGLGIFVRSSSTSDLRLLSPLASHSTSPTLSNDASVDRPMPRLLLSPRQSSLPTPSRTAPPKRRQSKARVSASQYANLGLGLPSEVSTTGTRFGSNFSLSSISRVFSIVPSASYAQTLFNGLPKLTRCSPFDPDSASTLNMGPFARLRSGAANFMRERVRQVSSMRVGGAGTALFRAEFAVRMLRMARDEGLRPVARFLGRK
ncbi:hypothetical protein MSAN_01128400 [Mycena sanguinolenta]|uniref:Uncharacterized protein n=1 Tax=Mycena sanguinolenta TaxID=230812 RepID=A0A8H6YLT4_9AGAR|nr:hypothetical protein MSAN_01128400 [Mycena sanguinolenta]